MFKNRINGLPLTIKSTHTQKKSKWKTVASFLSASGMGHRCLLGHDRDEGAGPQCLYGIGWSIVSSQEHLWCICLFFPDQCFLLPSQCKGGNREWSCIYPVHAGQDKGNKVSKLLMLILSTGVSRIRKTSEMLQSRALLYQQGKCCLIQLGSRCQKSSYSRTNEVL